MAKADPYIDYPSDHDEEGEDEAAMSQASAPIEENRPQPSPGSSKQNGSLMMSNVDRYGFIGGAQYTDPNEYVK